MKGLIELVKILIITVIGGLVVVLAQDPVKQFFLGPQLSATAIVGTWGPKPDSDKIATFDISSYDDLIQENNSFARIYFRNASNKPLKSIRFTYGQKWLAPDILFFKDDSQKGDFFPDARSVKLPDLQPGEGLYILAWKTTGFGWPSFFEDLEIFTDSGAVSIKYETQKDENGYDHSDGDMSFFGFILYFWQEILLIISVVGIILALISDYLGTKYYKKLIQDDDFWLKERQRLDDVGPDKFVPDISNLE